MTTKFEFFCARCREKIDTTKPHINLLIQEEIDNSNYIEVLHSDSLGLYHKECSPFKFTVIE